VKSTKRTKASRSRTGSSKHGTLHGRDAVFVRGVAESDRMQRPVSGRDIVSALASSPLGDVSFDRLTVKSPVRDVDL